MWSPIGRRRCGCGATSYDFAVTATTIAHPARPRQDDAADPGPSRPQAPASLPCARRGCADLCGVISTRGWQSIRRRWPRRRLSTECAGPRVVVGWAAKAPRRTGSNHRPVVSAGAIVTGADPLRAASGRLSRRAGHTGSSSAAKSRLCIRSALGAISCPDLMPDLWRLVDDFDVAVEELLECRVPAGR